MKLKSKRYHGFDALRSSMLLLGVFLHVSLSYFPNQPGMRAPNRWYFYDDAESWLAVVFYVPVHIYRLPIFFVLAGFFTLLLISRRSLKAMVLNRLQRVALPLILAVLLLLPLMHAATKFACLQPGSAIMTSYGRNGVWHFLWNDLHYLWFLWHLLLLCLITAVAGLLLQKVNHRLQETVRRLGEFLVCSPAGIATLVVLTTLLNIKMHPWPGFVETNATYIPAGHVFAAYGVYFFYGLALYANRQALDRIVLRSWRCLTIGVVLLAVYGMLLLMQMQENTEVAWMPLVLASVSAVAGWAMIWGLMGVAIRYCQQPNAIIRYVADSSYWVYLAHMPVLFLVQGWLAPLDIAGIAKLCCASALTMAICMISYQLFVRDTAIGMLLNGRRHPASSILPRIPAQAPPSILESAD